MEKVEEGWRGLEKVEEGWRRLQKVGEGCRRLEKVEEGWRRLTKVEEDTSTVPVLLDVFLHKSALIPATELSSRLPGDTPSGFILTGYGSDPRFLGGGYEGSKFPRNLENIETNV